MPKKSDWDLGEFSRALSNATDIRAQERAELNAKLGEPHEFVSDEGDPRFGTGFWRGEGGVFSYRRYANGYDPFSRMEYPDEFIERLVRLRKGSS